MIRRAPAPLLSGFLRRREELWPNLLLVRICLTFDLWPLDLRPRSPPLGVYDLLVGRGRRSPPNSPRQIHFFRVTKAGAAAAERESSDEGGGERVSSFLRSGRQICVFLIPNLFPASLAARMGRGRKEEGEEENGKRRASERALIQYPDLKGDDEAGLF